MKINRQAIKQNAKLSMRGRKPSVYLVALIYLAIVYILGALVARINSGSIQVFENAMNYLISNDESYLMDVTYRQPNTIGSLLNIALQLMNIILAAGFTIFCLNVSRALQADIGNLFDGFARFFRIIWLEILIGLFVFLWSLLFVIPGIVASYRYRQALYIMLDNPEMSAINCIRTSKAMMRGRKWELFVLDLSFIGWILLSALPFVSIYTSPYMQITYANYYNALLGAQGADSIPDYSAEQSGSQANSYDSSRDPWDN